MTFLPIVERELRAAARRRATFGMRIRIAGGAALAVAASAVASLIAPSVTFGPSLFWGLSGLCMVYCLFAGRLMTADCLSREKREGTLGLLFLTDLNGYDIVMGKLAATSLTGFYVLIALLPFLAVPFLAGGMTSGELWRMALVLVNTFLFSLAVGLFASSISRDQRKAMGANLLLLLALTLGLPVIAGINFLRNGHPPIQELLYSCPVYAFVLCADKLFAAAPARFWWSVATTLDMTVILTLLACHTEPRSWKDKFTPRPLPRKSEPRSESLRHDDAQIATPFRRRLLNVNAYLWLASRPQRKAFYVWALIIVVGCWWSIPQFFFPSIKLEAGCTLAVMLNIALKLWVTVEAGHQLAEDKKSGAFELLLTTPMTLRDIVRGQWLALRRQFLGPLIMTVAFELVLMVLLPYKRTDFAPAMFLWPAFIIMLVADLVTLVWAAMSAALAEKSHDRATMKTILFVLIVPSLLFAAVLAVERLWNLFGANDSNGADWKFYLAWWFGLGLWADSIILVRARRRLQARFAQNLPESAAQVIRSDEVQDAQKATSSPPLTFHKKLRRIAIATAVLVLLGAVAVLCAARAMHMDPPKPVIASMSRSNNPIRLFASAGFLSVFPNGTLWRWGHSQGVSPPAQIGTASNWVEISVRNNTAVGIRSDGSLWKWDSDKEEPKQFDSSHDWAQASASQNAFIALKKDGALWNLVEVQNERGKNALGPTRYELTQVGTNHDWKAVSVTFFGARLALRSDGTLWTWGDVHYMSFGMWSSTNYPALAQLCRESDWVGFCDGIVGGVRNQSGQLWDFSPLLKRPGPEIPVASLGNELSTNTTSSALGIHFNGDWTMAFLETRTDGTLWAAPTSWQSGYRPKALPFRVGQRSDWVSIWGAFDSTVGLTADGMLWAWGKDYGQPAHYEFGEKLGVIREMIATLMQAPQHESILSIHEQYNPYYPQNTPRPLLELVFTNSPSNK